jgi:hypothetical protein
VESQKPIIATVREERHGGVVRRLVEFDGSEVFFEIEGGQTPPPLELHDFAAFALVFTAMRQRRPLHINGPVSLAALRNLEEFQEVFAAWRPKDYQPVAITAAEVPSSEAPRTHRSGVFAFSGGVDGSYALLRHVNGQAGRRTVEPVGALVVHGFDIPLDEPAAFEIARAGAAAVLAPLGIPLSVVRTNWRQVCCQRWELEFGCGLAACLHQFEGLATHGVLGADEDYAHLVLPWASNPITNRLLSGNFEIYTEGGGQTRTQRVALICETPAVAERLRVCWEGPMTGQNCGVCEKCVRTKLNFMANNHPPLCFDRPPTAAEILGINARNDVQLAYLTDIVEVAEANGIEAPWVASLKVAIRRNHLLNPWRPAVRRNRARIARVTRALSQPVRTKR